MEWFDFLEKTARLPPPAAKKKAAQLPKKNHRAQHDTIEEPKDEVTVHWAMPEPCVILTKGVVVFANFCVAGDDPDMELDAIFGGIRAMLDNEAPPAHVVDLNRTVRLDELFAPVNAEILPFRSPLSWIFHEGSVASLSADPRRLRAVLRCMYAISKREDAPIQQSVYLVDPASPETSTFVYLVRGLGLVVTQPDDYEGEPRAMLEVERPEETILCAMTRMPYPADDLPDDCALDMNNEMAWAEAAGLKESALLRLQEQELAGLVAASQQY